MPRYRIRDGEVLAHEGQVLEAGAFVELPRAIADDMAVRGALEEVDDAGQPVAPVPVDDLARFRTHERVSMLRDRLVEAQGRVTAIQAQLDAVEQQLADEVAAAQRVAAAAPSHAEPIAHDAAPDSPAS